MSPAGGRAPDLLLGDLPEARLRPRRRIELGLVWLVPLLAIAIAGWLMWTSLRDRGPLITVSFETAEGLEPGKTRVKHRDVPVGTVEAVRLSPDLARIEVTIRMDAGTEPMLHEGTRFWIVRPRVGAGGVSGLGTLLSGAYVELDWTEAGPARRVFEGLEEPPLIRATVPGTRYFLHAERLDGISRGAPIYHRGLEVGQVLGYRLEAELGRVVVPIFVQAPYDRLVGSGTRFWNASGVSLGTRDGSLELQLASLQAVLLGGIEFEGPARDGEVAPPDSEFPLYRNATAAAAAGLTYKVPVIVEFEGRTRGLRPGAAVETRGIRIGTVRDVWLAWREQARGLVVQARLELEPERVSPVDATTGGRSRGRTIEELVAAGVRAQLRTASLLTGELFVDLDVYPDALPTPLRRIHDLPVIPSVPTELETLSASLTGVLEKLAALPLDQLVEELRTAIRAAGALAQGEKAMAALDSIAAAAESLRRVAAAAEGDVPTLLRSLRQSAEQARESAAALEAMLGPDSRTRADLNVLLREAAAAARALKAFAELLQRNPEALLRGRAGSGAR